MGPLMVNTYGYASPGHLAVFDPGWPWTLDALEAALCDLGLAESLSDVDTWLYTHSHVDHMGAAALLADRSDAEHIAFAGLEPHFGRWHAFLDDVGDWTPWAAKAFAEDFAIAEARRWRDVQRRRGELMRDRFGPGVIRNARTIEFGDTVTVGDLRLEFVDARGHDRTHGVFLERERGWLFSGDVVIATPTPISRSMDDDLSLYRESLDRLEDLDAAVLLPGHGVHRQGNLTKTFARSRRYLDTYRDDVLTQLDADEERSLLELGLATTPDGKPLQPRGRWVVHLALIDSHLHEMIEQSIVDRHEGPRYSLS